MKKKLLSLFLVLAMALTLMPTMAFAAECDGTESCTGDTHNKDCVSQCTGDDSCQNTEGTASAHKSGCPKATASSGDTCTGAEDCPATSHDKDCVSQCSGDENCQNTAGTASAHKSGCPKATASSGDTCTGAEDCPATSHNKDCVSQCSGDENCQNTAGTASAHKSGCPKATASGGDTEEPTPGAASFGTVTWVNGTLTWTYTPATGVTVDAAKFHISVDGTDKAITVTPGTAANTYTAPLSQTSAAQSVEITYDADATPKGTCTVPAAPVEADTSKAINPTNVKYNPKTGDLTWTMTGITAENAVATANNWFFVGFYTTKGVAVDTGIAAELEYNPNYGRNPISISGNTFSANVPQSSSLRTGTKYVIYVENRRLEDGEMVKYEFTAVAASQQVVDIPSVSKNPTTSEINDIVSELSSKNEKALASTVLNSGAADYENLDNAAKTAKGITVTANTGSAPAFIKDSSNSVKIVGAALNATENATLTFAAAKTNPTLPSDSSYDHSSAAKFSITTTKISSPSNLRVPIVITVPRPENMLAKNIVVLHYSTQTSFTVIYPKVTSKTVTFVVPHFSDFVITEDTDVDNTTMNGSKNPGSSSTGSSSRPTNGGSSISGVTGITVIPNTPSTSSGIFTDVPSGHTFATQITWARDNNVMGGYSDGSFRPNANTNRQQLWMVLGRLAGSNPADMAAARTWAINAGISDGTNAQGAMSRQQLVTMLYRFAQSQGKTISGSADLSSYPDSGAVASYAQEALAWAVGNGIVTGTSDGKLNPEGTASRAHFAVFLYRFSHMS